MRCFWAFALVFSASSAEAACVFDSATMSVHGKHCPRDVAAVVEQSNLCLHFASEPFDENDEWGRQRKAFLEQRLQELKCDALVSKLKAAQRKYKNHPKILRFLKENGDFWF